MKKNGCKWRLNNATILVGLTGTVAGGKTTLANYFKKSGIKVLNADTLALTHLEKGKTVYKKILKRLGRQILNTDGSIDKTLLAEKIFSNPKLRSWLENLIHPYVLKEFKNHIEKTDDKIIICDIPLLFERNLDDWFHLTVCVYANRRISLQRIKKRGWTAKEFDKRTKAQLPVKEKIRRADVVIENSLSLKKLYGCGDKLLKVIKTLAK
jgi:dephospho-CoA kinase